jgi:hypothetical protein
MIARWALKVSKSQENRCFGSGPVQAFEWFWGCELYIAPTERTSIERHHIVEILDHYIEHCTAAKAAILGGEQ